ncbi:hypothetical protein ACFYOT_35810 [Saccharothrix saharensis]|uniref:hypothetical protein n=1 Tax=Saccharothrix saharensis TaxID=571190 RepID=UPI0036A55EDB
MSSAIDATLPELDVVMPVAPKDASDAMLALRSLLRHCRNPIRAVHVVSASPPGFVDQRVRWLDESLIEPGPAEVEAVLRASGSPHGNATWYFQQLVKLGCFALPGITADHVLVTDADLAFVADVTFVDRFGRALVAWGYPLRWGPGPGTSAAIRHSALRAASRMVPGWCAVDGFSGMHHHMVFERRVAAELVRLVERAHGAPFWRAFLAALDGSRWTGASEYVLYRHFASRSFPERVVMRHLSTAEVIQGAGAGGFTLADVLAAPRPGDVRAVGCHRFLDYADRIATMDYISDALRRELPANTPLTLRLRRGEVTVTPTTTPLSFNTSP